jgi:RNA polymerase sigma factor (sigma-70 family)
LSHFRHFWSLLREIYKKWSDNMRTADGYIISKCLNDGDSTAFGLLVDKYKASIYALAYSKLHNFHDAEDVTQEVFVKAYRNLRKLRRWDNFFAWLYSITSNLCKDFLQEKAKFSDSEFIEDQSVDMLKTSSIRSFHDEVAFESIREALDSLPEIYQQVLTLHYLGGMTGEEISEFLGVPHPTIRQRLSRARSMLKEEMIAMINTGYEQQKLSASFTFRIIEMVKKIRINPTSGIKSLPYGLSIGAGIIFAILSFGQHIQINLSDIAMGLPLPSDTKILKVGEIPVDAVKVAMITSIGNKGDGKGFAPDPKGQENAFFMSPQDEGGTWEQKANMPTGRFEMAMATIDGKIYVMGGQTPDGPYTAKTEEYDPKLDRWERKADMPTARCEHSATVVNGKIYVIGGWGGNEVPYSVVEVYDPKSDSWETKTPMPSTKYWHTAVNIENKIYVLGGDADAQSPSLSVYIYDPAFDQWSQLNDIPKQFAITGSTSVSVGGNIYFFGGTNPTNNIVYGNVIVYDTIKRTWKEMNAQILKRSYGFAAKINNKIYFIGGRNFEMGKFFSNVEEYDIPTDTIKNMPEMPHGRCFIEGCAIGNQIFVIGGLDEAFTYLSLNEVYTPDTAKSVDSSGKFPKTWGMLKAK